MDIEFDAVVIGGGPAGSAAAHTLATAGRRVCIIDKARFPREKLCGGLVTPRSKSTFEAIFGGTWKDELFNSSRNIEFFADGQFLAPQEAKLPLFFTMRFSFDDYLLGLAREAGAVTMLGETIETIDLDRSVVKLQSGEEVRFRFLIGADGVNSLVAKTLFGTSFNQHTIGFGLEVEVPRERLPSQADTVEIDFGAAHWGYGWVFPKARTFTIGVGGIHRLNPDLRARLDAYLRHKQLDSHDFKVKGQYIPFGDYRKQPGAGNVLLCGDAAGTVDPITGEGIAFAMQSGAAAGRAVVKACSGLATADALRAYCDDYRAIVSSIRQANFWRRFIFPKFLQRPFAWAFADAGTLQRGYLDILAGTREYNDLPGLFVVQAGKALRKLGRKAWGKLAGLNSSAH
jgi:menaquinone-9 beta-reductase